MRQKCVLRPQDIVSLYTISHLSPSQISKLAGVSRQRIWKIVKENGINTSRGLGGGTRVKDVCDFCGKEIELMRAYWRRHKEHFCSGECYYASRENPAYYQSRQGQRLARVIVNQHFRLESGYVVHHKDGNTKNNSLNNLSVYVCNGDHIKATHHKNSTVKPIWEGVSN